MIILQVKGGLTDAFGQVQARGLVDSLVAITRNKNLSHYTKVVLRDSAREQALNWFNSLASGQTPVPGTVTHFHHSY